MPIIRTCGRNKITEGAWERGERALVLPVIRRFLKVLGNVLPFVCVSATGTEKPQIVNQGRIFFHNLN